MDIIIVEYPLDQPHIFKTTTSLYLYYHKNDAMTKKETMFGLVENRLESGLDRNTVKEGIAKDHRGHTRFVNGNIFIILFYKRKKDK